MNGIYILTLVIAVATGIKIILLLRKEILEKIMH